MSALTDVGNLMYLYLEEIEAGDGIDIPEYLINATAKLLTQRGGRNWVPIIVKETGKDRYEVIGNSFIYAVAEAAGLERVWCIVADSSDTTTEVTKVLAGETVPQISLSTATRDEISSALKYLVEQNGSPLKGIKLAVALNRIDEAPRQYWKTLDPITKLSCGITKGKKLDALKKVFYLTPQPLPEIIKEPSLLSTLTVTELKKMAKKREITISSKATKTSLIELLSQ